MKNEISAAQLEANRLNAQKSTGPRTEEGKANARFNARRHGLTGQFYCMSEEDEKAYKTFESDMLADLKPSGAYETQLAISITQDQWRLNRSRSVEFNLYGKGHDLYADNTDAPTPNMQAASTMADTYQSQNRVFANIALYETRLHRMITRNRRELNDLQSERKAAETKAREDAENLIRLADLLDEPLSSLAPPTDGLSADKLLVDGFVFSVPELKAQMKRETLLRIARECAKEGWDADRIQRRRILDQIDLPEAA